jgi:hypothetical protein
MASFFTQLDLEFFRQRLVTRQAYRRANASDVVDGQTIYRTIYTPTNEWAQQITQQLPTYNLILDNRWLIGGGYFKKYSWARLFLRELGDQGIYVTVGVDGPTGNLVWKLDFQFAGDDPLPEATQALLRAELDRAGSRWQQVSPLRLGEYDWTRLVTETVAFMQANEPLFRRLHELATTPTGSFPELVTSLISTNPPASLNTILYGPPGTGKTYSTIERAYTIMEGQPAATYETARQVFQQRLHDQVEFVTFHQSFTYEDFIQGIRPTVSDEGQMLFKLHNGIFYELAQRARRNWERSQAASLVTPTQTLSFEEVLTSFMQPVIEELNPLTIGMQWPGYSFTLTQLNQSNIWFKTNGQAGSITHKQVIPAAINDVQLGEKGVHSLNLATLKQLYEHGVETGVGGGLMSYYKPLAEVLLQHATTMPRAAQEPLKRYVLIIDEINRANISKVFGELLTLLEADKRLGAKHALTVRLPSGEPGFSVPPNLYLLGTMNTADKSIALLDIALRRRFDFEPLYPVYKLGNQPYAHADLLRRLNEQIVKHKSRDFQIGHAYFLEDKPLQVILDQKVIPLLYEYFLNDATKVKQVLVGANIPHSTDQDTGLLCYYESATNPPIPALVSTAAAAVEPLPVG